MWRDPGFVAGLALVVGLATGGAQAQIEDRGAEAGPDQAAGRTDGLAGRVMDPEGRPIIEARVHLKLLAPQAAAGLERRALTGEAGAWQAVGLRAGVWQIEVEALGYRSTTGKVDLRSGRRSPVEVTLEFDSEKVVRGWLERANALLEEQPAVAADLYRKALGVLRGGQAAVYRALARAEFLQGRADDAAASLQRALLVDPQDGEARLLLTTLQANAGRGAEADRWLEILDGAGVAAAGAAAFAVPVPTLDLVAGPTGRFRSTLDAASPTATDERLLAAFGSWEVLGLEAGAPWSPAGESFEFYVPPRDGLRPPAAAEPATAAVPSPTEERYGLLVWISPTPRGGLPDAEMTTVLDRERLIWVGANDSGNARPPGARMRLALDAAAGAQGVYAIDPERIYIGGYSGGGRMASAMALHFADIFTGGLYFMGVDFYRQIAKADQPGMLWGSVLRPPSPAMRQLIARRSRFVFITGDHDFNRAQTQAFRTGYLEDGIERVHLIQIPEAGHYHGFKAAELEAALAFLDTAGRSNSGELDGEALGR